MFSNILNKFSKININSISGGSESDNNELNNNSNSNNKILPIYLQKKIIIFLSDHINYYYKLISIIFENDYRDVEENINQLVLNIALVSKQWFSTISLHIKISVDFNYDSNLVSLFYKQGSKEKISKNEIIPLNKISSSVSDSDSIGSKYSIIKAENIETIKLHYDHDQLLFYKRIQDRYDVVYSKSVNIVEKLKEMKNLKRILIRNLNLRSPIDSSFLDFGNIKNIQLLEFYINNSSDIGQFERIKKINSIVIGSCPISQGNNFRKNIIIKAIQYFYKGLEQIYFYSRIRMPFEELSGYCYSVGNIDRSGSILVKIPNQINYLDRVQLFQLLDPITIKDLYLLVNSTINIHEINIAICFEMLLWLLSSDQDQQIPPPFCTCVISHRESDQETVTKSEFKELFKLVCESLNKRSKLTTFSINNICSFLVAPADQFLNTLASFETVDHFSKQLALMFSSVPNLKKLEISGINSLSIINHLLETNLSIHTFKLNIQSSVSNIKNFITQSNEIIKKYSQIKYFKLYSNGNILFKFKNSKNNIK